MSDYKLSPDKPIDVAEILKDLENYRPRRRGWTWRKPVENLHMGPFVYHDCTEPLKSSVPLPPAHYFENIDPQPAPVITTEIASGRFEDDIRRMRMAAHHGADHIMVIRTAGQSHFDGLIDGWFASATHHAPRHPQAADGHHKRSFAIYQIDLL